MPEGARIINADCLAAMREMPDASVDAIVTDPPYEYSFMGKSWDATGIAYSVELWTEALRVLKPGGHLLAFGGTRTYHRLACAIEDAGFEIRDSVMWLYGSGFPKSLNLKDKWQGWGTALKPAHEPVVVARKPLVGTVAANVLEHGTGAINIDGCRVMVEGERPLRESLGRSDGNPIYGEGLDGSKAVGTTSQGRWPANLVLSHADGCEEVGTREERSGAGTTCSNRGEDGKCLGHRNAGRSTSGETFHGPDTASGGTETVAVWECVPGCPVAELDAQSGTRPGGQYPTRRGNAVVTEFASGQETVGGARAMGDTGGASRFFYCAKPSRRERNAGLDGMPEVVGKRTQAGGDDTRGRPTPVNQNHHPTVKPVAVMRWLIRLVTPPGGVVLDPFLGSGTTGIAAVEEGFDFIGIEREPDYAEIARRRIAHAQAEPRAEQLAL